MPVDLLRRRHLGTTPSTRCGLQLAAETKVEIVKANVTGTTWGGCVITLRISTHALVFSAAWIRVTVWSRTPHINSAIWTISGSQANTCVSAPSPKRDCPAVYPGKAAILILAMEATKHDWHHLHGTTIKKRIPTQVPSVMQQGGTRNDPCHPWG